jgi:hypothetical protein
MQELRYNLTVYKKRYDKIEQLQNAGGCHGNGV